MLNNDIGTARAWGAVASDLAHWAWARLVNRTDVWGGYIATSDREKIVAQPDGTTGPLGATMTRPAKAKRGQLILTLEVLERHFRATAGQHVIGLHTTSPENTCRWGAVEVDHHGESSTPAETNFRAAIAWYVRLRDLGFRPLLTDSNGKGGFHLLTIFSAPTPSATVYDFLRWLSKDHATHGLSNRPETYPKQRMIAPGRFGNWLRVPGRHHTREHWSRVWNGTGWLEGTAAVDYILAVHGDVPSLIPKVALVKQTAAAPFVPAPRQTDNSLAGRIRCYIAKMPSGLGEGQHRDDFAFQFACFLARDLALPDADALGWLAEWDGRQAVAKGEAHLRHILENAKKYGHRPVGCGLRPPRAPKTVSVEVEV